MGIPRVSKCACWGRFGRERTAPNVLERAVQFFMGNRANNGLCRLMGRMFGWYWLWSVGVSGSWSYFFYSEISPSVQSWSVQPFFWVLFYHFFSFSSSILLHLRFFFFTSRPWFFRVRFHLFWVLSSCFLFFLINHDQKQLPDGGRNFVSSGEEAEKASKEGKGGIPGGCLQVYHHKGGPTIAPLLGFGVATETPLLWLKPFEGVLSS